MITKSSTTSGYIELSTILIIEPHQSGQLWDAENLLLDGFKQINCYAFGLVLISMYLDCGLLWSEDRRLTKYESMYFLHKYNRGERHSLLNSRVDSISTPCMTGLIYSQSLRDDCHKFELLYNRSDRLNRSYALAQVVIVF